MSLPKAEILKKDISFMLFLVINLLFAEKYLSRITDYSLLLALLLSVVYLAVYRSAKFLPKLKAGSTINAVIIIGFLIASTFAFSKIPVESLNVDRWSVITSFWETVFSGEYGYFAKSNVGNEPGPMPFYFLLALPFYIIGELGYLSVLGLVAFYLILRYCKIAGHLQTLALLLLAGSSFFLWEVICRSNIFINACLALVALLLFLKNQLYNNLQLLLLGTVIGLVLSTRNVFVIPLCVAFIYALKSNRIGVLKVIGIGTVAVLVFAATFLPFVINHFDDFKVMNPFIVQSSFLIPFEYTLGFIGLSLLAGFICKSVSDVYFYSGVTLFSSIAIYLCYHIVTEGLIVAFYGNMADISYFILSAPFLMFHFIHIQNAEPEQCF